MRKLFQALLAACVLGITPLATRAAPVAFDYSPDKACTTSAGVYTPAGRLVRRLWWLKKSAAGANRDQWDGLDDLGRNVPPGAYEVRVACSNATFSDVGTLGNSGVGTPMQSGTDDLITDRATGDIYTANNWEEAGQDFRKMDADGKHLMDAKFRIRNGTPNGWPIAVALDNGVLYCSVFTVHEKVPGEPKTLDGGAVLRKFSAATGELIPFPTPGGYVRVKEPDPDPAAQKDVFAHQSLHSITVCGDTIVAADRDTGTVYKFDKNTGKSLGQFHFDSPACVITDHAEHAGGADRLWVAHSRNKVSLTDLDGKVLAEPELPAKQIACIRLDREGRLWVADQEAGQVQVYKIDAPEKPAKLTQVRTYGHKAEPGQFEPLAIGRIQSFDVMPDGGFVLAQTYGHGSVVTRFNADGNVVWQQVGLEFCTNGAYDQRRPDLFISSLSNAYRLLDPDQGKWKFEGCLYQGPLKLDQSTGTPRFLERDGRRYFYSLTGEVVKVFRFEGNPGNRLVPSALVGLSFSEHSWDKKLLGEVAPKDRPTHYAWHDANGDGQIQPEEMSRVIDPKTQIPTFSCEVDPAGNLIFPNHQTGAIDELPLETFDDHGNPVYDWSRLKERLPKDDTLLKLMPQKACPLPGGGLYVLQTAERSIYAPSDKDTGFGKPADVCWMGGWVLSKYDGQGSRLFTFPLPDVCTGMDFIPNLGRTEELGVLVGCYNAEQLYHYSPDGLLLQILSPKHKTGWLDHNGSISVNRNPKDGLVDVFAEESLCNRISWYRLDDRDVKTLKVAVKKEATPGERYSDASQFDALLRAGEADAKAGHAPAAIEAYTKALDLAAEAEKPAVHYRLGKAYQSARQPDEAVKQLQLVVDAPHFAAQQKADLLIEMSRLLRQEKKYDEAAAALERLMTMKLPADYHYTARAMLELADVRAAEGKADEALRELQKVKEQAKSGKSPSPDLYRQACVSAGNLLRTQKRYEEAIQEYEQSGQAKGIDANGQLQSEALVAECYQLMKDPARAARQFEAASENHPKAEPRLRAETLLRAADCQRQAGDKDAARKLCERVRDLPDVPADQKNSAEQRLAQLRN